jgi:hypothetical protein
LPKEKGSFIRTHGFPISEDTGPGIAVQNQKITLFAGRMMKDKKKKISACSLRARECTYSVSRRIRTAD